MKFKKHIRIKDGNQVWRILISSSDKLVVETRNTDKKEAFFNCYNILTGKKIFAKFQLGEKYWLGIEEIYNDIILFHRFTKPDMPGHKSIIAFDIMGKKVLWENDEYSFLFIYNNKIYCYKQIFEGRRFYTISPDTGNVIDELGEDASAINELKYLSDRQKDYSHYIFTTMLGDNANNKKIMEIIESQTALLNLVGKPEYLLWDEYLLFNFHHKVVSDLLENKFVVYNIEQQKIVLSEILNSAVNSFVPDSFFVFKNFLILLKEKKEVLVLSKSE